MADINHVTLVGRLTRDAEMRYSSGGLAICRFSVAINRRRKQEDVWTDEANFFDVVLLGRMGEAIHKFLVKGKQIGVDGELHQSRWEKDGQPRSKVEIMARNVQLLGSPSGGGASETMKTDDYGSASSGAEDYSPSGTGQSERFEDDVPF